MECGAELGLGDPRSAPTRVGKTGGFETRPYSGTVHPRAARSLGRARQFNLREGMTPADDTLPPRLLNEPLRSSGERLTEKELKSMVADYYERRGWDRAE